MARVVATAVLWSAVSGLVFGCSGKTEEEGDEPQVNPVAACQTYASTWCNKAFNCYVEVGRLDPSALDNNVSECTRIIVEKFPCSAASDLGDSYDQCLSQVRGMACSKWNVPQIQFGTVRPPASCDTALSFE